MQWFGGVRGEDINHYLLLSHCSLYPAGEEEEEEREPPHCSRINHITHHRPPVQVTTGTSWALAVWRTSCYRLNMLENKKSFLRKILLPFYCQYIKLLNKKDKILFSYYIFFRCCLINKTTETRATKPFKNVQETRNITEILNLDALNTMNTCQDCNAMYNVFVFQVCYRYLCQSKLNWFISCIYCDLNLPQLLLSKSI